MRSLGLAIVLVVLPACAQPPSSGVVPLASPSGAAASATTVPGCVDCVVRTDAVLGLAFPAPRAFSYLPARASLSTDLVVTETARLSSYSLDGSGPSDLSRELLVELFAAPRRGEDLETIAKTRFAAPPASGSRLLTIDGHPAMRFEGNFQNGSRIFVLIEADGQRVLVLSALPRESSRIADFERLLQYLVLR